MNSTLNFIIEHWLSISSILLLIILRVIPTEKNRDIAKGILKLLDYIVPNLKKGGGKHLSIILLFISFYSFSQTPVTTQSRGLFLYNGGDTTSLKNTRTSLQTATGNTGGMFFDRHNNKWRVWDGTTWVNWNLFNASGIGSNFWPLGGNASTTTDVEISVANNTVTSIVTSEGIGMILQSQSPGDDLVSIGHSNAVTTYSDAGTIDVVSSNTQNYSSGGSFIYTNISSTGNFSVGDGIDDPNIVDIRSATISSYTAGTTMTLSGNTSIALNSGTNGMLLNDASNTFSALDGTKILCNPNATRAGLNVGTNGGAIPSVLVNGDVFSANGDILQMRNALGGTQNIVGSGTLTANRIPFAGGAATLTDDSDFTFTGGNILNVPNIQSTALNLVASTSAITLDVNSDLIIDSPNLNAASGVTYMVNTNLRNEGAFTYNPTGNLLSLSDGTFTVADGGTGATVVTRENGDIRVDTNGDTDFTTYSENNITTASGDNLTITATSATLNLVGTNVQINGTSINLSEGTFTPTASGATNLASNTPLGEIYTIQGNTVTVYGSIILDPSAATTLTQLDLSISIATTNTNDLRGTITTSGSATAQTAGSIFGDGGTEARLQFFTLTDVGSLVWYYNYRYTVN